MTPAHHRPARGTTRASIPAQRPTFVSAPQVTLFHIRPQANQLLKCRHLQVDQVLPSCGPMAMHRLHSSLHHSDHHRCPTMPYRPSEPLPSPPLHSPPLPHPPGRAWQRSAAACAPGSPAHSDRASGPPGVQNKQAQAVRQVRRQHSMPCCRTAAAAHQQAPPALVRTPCHAAKLPHLHISRQLLACACAQIRRSPAAVWSSRGRHWQPSGAA